MEELRVEYMGERALPSPPQKLQLQLAALEAQRSRRKSEQHARTANFRSCFGGQVPHALLYRLKLYSSAVFLFCLFVLRAALRFDQAFCGTSPKTVGDD